MVLACVQNHTVRSVPTIPHQRGSLVVRSWFSGGGLRFTRGTVLYIMCTSSCIVSSWRCEFPTHHKQCSWHSSDQMCRSERSEERGAKRGRRERCMSDNGAQLPLYVHVYTAGCQFLTRSPPQTGVSQGTTLCTCTTRIYSWV